MAEMDDVKNLEIAQINDENLRREREKLQAENPTREDIAPVDVKTDPGRTYFNDAPDQQVPAQNTAQPDQQTPPPDFEAPRFANGTMQSGATGDHASKQIISAPVQGTKRARTTYYFGNESAMPQAFAQAAKQYNAPQSAEDRTSADYIASLNRTYSERRRQNGLRNDLIVTNAAAALNKQGFGDGETRRVMEAGALADINRSLEDAGATYRVTGMTMTKNEAGAPQFVVRTVDRNGKTHIHLRSAEEMYDVALAARRGLADQRGVRAPQSVDAKGNPTGEPDQYELANIESWGDVRGTRKAWETRNADTIEKNKIMREKMDADRRLAIANILKQYDANALTKQNRGERLTEILKDTTKNAPLLATFGILKQKIGEDGKPAEDLNGNPIYEPNDDNAQVQEGVARLRQMFGEEADRRSATADVGSWMKSLFPDLLGTPAQSVPAPAQSPAAPAAAPAPTTGVTQAVSEHSADELKAALEARKAAQPVPEDTIRPPVGGQAPSPGKASATKPVATAATPTTGVKNLDDANSAEAKSKSIEGESVDQFMKIGGIHELNDDGSKETFRIANWDYLPESDKMKWPESTDEFREWYKFAQVKANQAKADFEKRRKEELAKVMADEQKKHPYSERIRRQNVNERMERWENLHNPEIIRKNKGMHDYSMSGSLMNAI